MSIDFEYTGTVEALQTAEIRARVPGYLEEIRFAASSQVSAGDVLFVIEPAPYEIAVRQAEAQRTQARAQLKLAEAQLIRNRRAFESRGVSEIDVLSAEADRDDLVGQLEAAEAALAQARLDLSYTQVRTPISGRVGRHLVDRGNLVGASENTLLTTVLQMDPVYAYFESSEDVTLQYFSRGRDGELKPEQRRPVFLRLSNEEGFPHEGQLDWVDNALDADTGTHRLRARFPNEDHRLYPGLFARIRVPFEQRENAVLIEVDAVGTDLVGKFVYVVDAESSVERRSVELGSRYGDYVHVESGLRADERVIVSGIQRARVGRPVSPELATKRPPVPAPPPAFSPDVEPSGVVEAEQGEAGSTGDPE